MAVFKCKMCGGNLEIGENQSVATCEYCNTQQTLPKLDSEQKINLYDRANHFRRNNDYDKAMAIYENILNTDTTDAEAYWSILLCRFGVEYVEDPSTHKQVPTINRAQFTSVLADEDYKSAVYYANSEQKVIYQREAAYIDEVQKGILEISNKEEPFDVFICYKETDSTGRRTRDSVLATELYHGLVNEGFKVFFSRITLEDKLGQEYEPYIFAALNSAKVMVVMGTKPENFNAVWVKNEWSRYLSLVKSSNGKKILIPAYKDMDPYDLPDEFSHLQAQDMSKLGFMQDVVRGIKKIIGEGQPNVVEASVTTAQTTNVAPLLKRAYMFLEDGDFARADEFCEQVLNIDPENAQAYFCKLMIELGVVNKEALKNVVEPFDNSNNYRKIIRYGDELLKKEVEDLTKYIKNRIEGVRKDVVLAEANKEMASAKISGYENAIRLFKSIPGWKDADAKVKECEKMYDDFLAEAVYQQAIQRINKHDYVEAIKDLSTIEEWKDSINLMRKCKGICQHCGGKFKGLFGKKCSVCGKAKDY